MSTPVRRRVYLHIGAPKTGTTYLQDRLTLNAKSLADHGVHYPSRSPLVSPSLFHFRAALDLQGQDWGGPPGHAEGSWDALVKRVGRRSGSVIVSHEILAPATREQAARAKSELGGPEVEIHVVYSARDLARQIPAAWQESVKQGRRWRYRRFLRRLDSDRSPWFQRAFDLPRVLTTWSAGLPPDHVHVVTVPQRGSDPDLLWQRFCTAFGIDPTWAPRAGARINPSLGVAETQLLRKLNRRMQRGPRGSVEYDELIRVLLAESELVNRRTQPVQLPPSSTNGRPSRPSTGSSGSPRAGSTSSATWPICVPSRPTRTRGSTPTRCDRGVSSTPRSTRWPR